MSFENITGFFFLSVISTIIATGISNFALGKVNPSTLSAFGGVSTLVTIASGVILNNEILYSYHYIGISLIVVRMIGVCYLGIRKISNSSFFKNKLPFSFFYGKINL